MSEPHYWCEQCESNHTLSFGLEFHDRILKPQPAVQSYEQLALNELVQTGLIARYV